jgi:hypothetical protein
LYKTRKKAFGPFKRKFWDLQADVRTRIGEDLEKKFTFLFERLNVQRTAELVKKTVTLVPVAPSVPPALTEAFGKVGNSH